MSDIVERLRRIGEWVEPKVWEHDPVALEAAAEIERRTTQLLWAMRSLKWIEGHTSAGGNDADKILAKVRQAFEKIGPLT